MRRIKRPSWIMTVTLVTALAMVGVAYGLWSKTLVLDGTVNTGTVDASYSLVEVDQVFDYNDVYEGSYTIGRDADGDQSLDDDLEAEGKDIAECSAEIDGLTGNMTVTVDSAYPLFNCFVKYDVHNTGTLPIHVYGPAYFMDGMFLNGGINTAALHVNGWPPAGDVIGVGEKACVGYTSYVQLEPGEELFCTLHIHLNQAAEQGATYTFQVQTFVRQWNEIVAPPWL